MSDTDGKKATPEKSAEAKGSGQAALLKANEEKPPVEEPGSAPPAIDDPKSPDAPREKEA